MRFAARGGFTIQRPEECCEQKEKGEPTMWNQRLSQLTDSDRKKIQVNRAQGMTLDQIARRFGVSSATISRAITDGGKKFAVKAAS